MEQTGLPLPSEIWAATPCAAQALILAQWERIRELEARLGQNSASSSRPPSSDPPQTPARLKAPPSGRNRGGQLLAHVDFGFSLRSHYCGISDSDADGGCQTVRWNNNGHAALLAALWSVLS